MRSSRRADSARSTQSVNHRPDWLDLLRQAVTVPGTISAAYRAFWHFSLSNILWAFAQCHQRGLKLGPLHTFRGWQRLGRQVRKGEKAIWLLMPVLLKSKRGGTDTVKADDDDERPARRIFIGKPHWFLLDQTDGEPYRPVEMPDWSEARALAALDIERIPFGLSDGNVQGYARERTLAVSPVAYAPWKTLMHEAAHIVLGHTTGGNKLIDGNEPDRSLIEVEAECVAMICCDALGLGGAEFSRGYIQHWLGEKREIPAASIAHIFHAADAILAAGRAQVGSFESQHGSACRTFEPPR